MWIIALILLATTSTIATAAPLHLNCKGNEVKQGSETPTPGTASVTIDGKMITVEGYPPTELWSPDDGDVWTFAQTSDVVYKRFGKINRVTGHFEIEVFTGDIVRRTRVWSFQGECHKTAGSSSRPAYPAAKFRTPIPRGLDLASLAIMFVPTGD
jgi:hypothetical protein